MSTVLITGTNRGIGLEFCRQLQERGEAVVAVCRTPSPELEQLGVRIEAGLELTDNGSGGYYGYRMSKTALCMAGKSLAIDLAPRGIAVAILHPGMVSTRMTGFTPAGISPETAVRGLLQRIDELTLETSGRFQHAIGEQLPW